MEDRGEMEEFSEPTAQDKKEGDEREDMLYQSGEVEFTSDTRLL